MEIDCPAHAIAIWLEGDNIALRFPDRQRIEIPQNLTMLLNILKPRARTAEINGRDHLRVGTKAAPVQYDVAAVAKIVRSGRPVPTAAQIAERKAKERKRLLNIDRKRMALKEANELLALVGL